jgi:hypothetical protein
MGLFSFFSAKNKTNNRAGTVALNRIACSTGNTEVVTGLLKVPQEQRGDTWLQEFYHHAKTAAFINGDPELFTGPDGFKYFVLRTPPAGGNNVSSCIENLKDDLLLEKGFGVVINPEGNLADWVFSYGDIVNLQLNKEFVSTTEQRGIEHIDMTKKMGLINKGEQWMVAQPSQGYLPKQTRAIIRSFLQRKGIKRPMIMLLCRKTEGAMQHQLVFNIHPEDFASDKQHNSLMQKISWFLPRHYTVISFSKKSGITRDFDML